LGKGIEFPPQIVPKVGFYASVSYRKEQNYCYVSRQNYVSFEDFSQKSKLRSYLGDF
jgi:hypothetical protein